jgi:hypothetical protein
MIGLRQRFRTADRGPGCIDSIVYLAKTSWSVSNVAASVLPDTAPNFLASRTLSMDRIWSSKINPFFPPCDREIRNGAGVLFVVIGATITVRKWSCISGGDMTTQGRDFLISLPTVGSSVTSHMSPRLTNPSPNLVRCRIRG